MSGLIPQTFIDDLLGKVDIVQVIEQRVPMKKQGREFSACCPFHNEKTPSFTVSPQKQFYHCFGCGAHGSAISFLMEYENLSFVESIESLAENIGLDVPREAGSSPEHKVDNQPIFDALKDAAEFFQRRLKKHPIAIEYLKKRGLSGEIARDFILGYAPESWDELISALAKKHPQSMLLKAGLISQNEQGRRYDKFRDRVMFPILNHRGQICAFGGRIIGNDEPKYLNSPETPVFNKSNTLYGLYEARKAVTRLDHFIIVEGYMDVVALAQAGIKNSVATLGTATTPDHLRLLLRGGVNELVFCFDGDRAGKKAAWRAVTQALGVIRDGHALKFLFLPDADDPDSYVRREGVSAFRQAVANAVPLSQYLITTLKRKHNTATMEGRASLNLEAEKLLQGLNAQLLRSQLEAALAQLTHIKKPVTHTRAQAIPRHQTIQMTPMRLAIAALLQHPELVANLQPQTLNTLKSLPGGELLAALQKIISANSELKSGQLVERFRKSEYTDAIDQLVMWQPPSAEEAIWPTLFEDSIQQLLQQCTQQRLSELLHHSESSELSAEEKLELKSLLTRKG
ncbi:MAG TPA: DNA primase [Gammaproteobacteria bacterium]|nr:DNA primase [Gammaproteobacteria bacterium]